MNPFGFLHLLLNIALALVVVQAVSFILNVVFSKRPEEVGTGADLAPCPQSPNCITSYAPPTHPHHVHPLSYTDDRAAAQARLLKVLKRQPRLTIIVEEVGYIYAEAHTPVFRFVDDIEFVFDDTEKVIHLRSASRLGRGDLGMTNRTRVEIVRVAFSS